MYSGKKIRSSVSVLQHFRSGMSKENPQGTEVEMQKLLFFRKIAVFIYFP
jgi:hypothetical protein